MTHHLCIFSCHNFHEELLACVQAEGWTNVVPKEFPARCGRPPMTWNELRSKLLPDCTQVIVLGSVCITALGPKPEQFPPVLVLDKVQCFHLIAGQTLVDAAMADGGYLMSPAWLRDWRERITELGFAPDTIGDFYRDFAKRLVLLDTGVDPDVKEYAKEFSKAAGLPIQHFAVGLDHMRLMLSHAVLKWRLEELRSGTQEHERAHSAELADHVCALDLLGRLTQLRHEADVIAAIKDLFRMLFAPQTLYYQSADQSGMQLPSGAPTALQGLQLSLDKPYAWTAGGKGFALLFVHDSQELGRILVDDLAFAQFRDRYLNMALAMAGVCALALESSRTRKRLVEAEKMASLGVMVAGIAHEINTPVGVGVLAASTAERATQKISKSFAERSMTQSSLQTYLTDTQSQIGLILSNLQRVGTLIDAFRHVAVSGLPYKRSAVRLGRCIQDVVGSLGERIASGRITVQVNCKDTLEIESYAGDWTSIFTNLVVNSLQHGFKDLSGGHIALTVEQSDNRLLVDYRDDGAGLTPEARQRVFDPFFTTDMQNGMGLGMHLVYNLITQRMGGTIACAETTGTGAHFRIEVPVRKELMP